jgi:hypothetical protein
MSSLPTREREELGRLLWRALGAGVVALVACIIGAAFWPAQFFRAYLAAYQFYLGIALGSFAIFMLYQLTGGAWGFLTRRLLEAAMRTLPLLAVLFIPIAIGVGYLFPWADPEVVAQSKQLQFNHLYLNKGIWWFRAALFFVLWAGITAVLSSWSRQEDRTGSPLLPRKFRLLSAPALVAYGVTITFASVDWVMSLQPAYHSTIFGPLYATGQLVTAQSFVLVVLAWLVSKPPFTELVSLETLNDLGNLLLTFLVIWSYMLWFNFMLSWIANLPEENIWFLPRSRNGWEWVAWSIFILHFAVPFFCLLLRDVKRNPWALASVAGLILFMQLVFLNFQVMPAFPNTTIAAHWMDFLIPVGLGGVWLAYFLWQLGRYPVLPLHDLNRAEAVHLRQTDIEAAAREEALHHG